MVNKHFIHNMKNNEYESSSLQKIWAAIRP